MIGDGYKINCMYVTREKNGEINLFGANMEYNNGPIVVIKSTKNIEGIGTYLYGEKYTNEYIAEKMKARPAHSFIGRISGPVSFPCDESKVSFV